jgi:hypothetical protein
VDTPRVVHVRIWIDRLGVVVDAPIVPVATGLRPGHVVFGMDKETPDLVVQIGVLDGVRKLGRDKDQLLVRKDLTRDSLRGMPVFSQQQR